MNRMTRAVTFLTGASSGLGMAVAPLLAIGGDAVALAARRVDLLQELAERIRSHGGAALCVECDVGSRESVHSAVERCTAELGPVTRLVSNAGIGEPTPGAKFNAEKVERILRTNLLGAVYCIEAVLPGMLERRSGHIVGISSLASYRGIPGSAAYCASKAALNALLESLRIELKPKGIDITTVCPGYVKTPLTEKNKSPMPFLMELEAAAKQIYKAIRRKKRMHSFPWPLATIMKISRFAPDGLYDWSYSFTGLKLE